MDNYQRKEYIGAYKYVEFMLSNEKLCQFAICCRLFVSHLTIFP